MKLTQSIMRFITAILYMFAIFSFLLGQRSVIISTVEFDNFEEYLTAIGHTLDDAFDESNSIELRHFSASIEDPDNEVCCVYTFDSKIAFGRNSVLVSTQNGYLLNSSSMSPIDFKLKLSQDIARIQTQCKSEMANYLSRELRIKPHEISIDINQEGIVDVELQVDERQQGTVQDALTKFLDTKECKEYSSSLENLNSDLLAIQELDLSQIARAKVAVDTESHTARLLYAKPSADLPGNQNLVYYLSTMKFSPTFFNTF